MWEDFFVITYPTLVNTSTSDQEKHGKYDSIGNKKEKSRVRIKRDKSDSYLTYGQSCKTYMELYVDTPQPPNKLICFMKM